MISNGSNTTSPAELQQLKAFDLSEAVKAAVVPPWQPNQQKQHNTSTAETPRQRVIRALEEHGSRSDDGGNTWVCPVHDDHKPSLSIKPEPGDTQPVVLFCQVGHNEDCTYGNIMRALEIEPNDLIGGRVKRAYPDIEVFTWVDDRGKPLYLEHRNNVTGQEYMKRYDADGIRVLPKPTDGTKTMDGVKRVLSGLPGILQVAAEGGEIVICEGPHAVAAAYRAGLNATTLAGGSNAKWEPAHTEVLRGCSLVTIWADRDKPGLDYGMRVYDALVGAGIPVRLVQSGTGGHGDDAVEHFDAGYTFVDVIVVDAMRDDVNKAKRRKAVDRRANLELAAEDWHEPVDDGSLLYQLEHHAPPMDYLVEPNIIPARGIIQVNAQYKAGKTTLIMNLVASLASGEPFLGEYFVNRPSGNIGYWNLEVDQGQFQEWFARMGVEPEAAARIFPQYLVGYNVDASIPVIADYITKWLIKHNIKVWVIDPQSKAYIGEENDNTTYNAWFRAVEAIQRAAGVSLVIIIHHAGHGNGEDGAVRGRGASAQQGNASVLYSYQHGGTVGEPPPLDDSRRYFAATAGRDVSFPAITVERDPNTYRLTVVHSSNGRAADQRTLMARKAARIVCESASPMNATQLKDALGKGGNGPKVAAIDVTVAMGWINMKEGPRGSKLYSPGSKSYLEEPK